MPFDPVRVEVWRHLFASIAEEMGATLEHTGYSPNLKERRDYSCALFDAEGLLVTQAAHIPVHLGAMPTMMESLRGAIRWRPGDMWICNDPAHGGTHLPDLTVVAPVFEPAPGRELLGFVANRAHHADVAGLAPGSLALSTDLYQEGLILPPVRLVAGGRPRADILAVIRANSRTPAERRGDLDAQVSANRTGALRLRDLAAHHGAREVARQARALCAHAEATVRAALRAAPEGAFRASDVLDDDGLGATNLTIRVEARLRAGALTLDFAGTDPAVTGPMNATEAVTRSACYYVVRCLAGPDAPANDGAFRPVSVVAPPGTLVNAPPSSAVAAGNVETSQRIVDVVLAALRPAFGDRIPAASQGTMNNVAVGGSDPARGGAFAYYETVCGGGGAGARGPGASAIHTHMTNTRNTPVEALEMHYPLRVRELSVRRGSGGRGVHPGGDGVRRSLELLAPARVSVLSERRRHAPPGVDGGEGGAPGRNAVVWPDGRVEELPGKLSLDLPTGAVLIVETPGGGGWGPPAPRAIAS
ncbi:MAG: hydantoinase B/oxoprolinase family protein [Chthonomonadales bacterium]|nr:hydantoinase B/oxoprolinase family protein [Chthonomonadales bacterium]